MSHVRECQQCGETYVPANGLCPSCEEHRSVGALGNHHTIVIVECPTCLGESRRLGAPAKWGDGSPTDFGPCPTCLGTGEVETEYECRTLDDIETEVAEQHCASR